MLSKILHAIDNFTGSPSGQVLNYLLMLAAYGYGARALYLTGHPFLGTLLAFYFVMAVLNQQHDE